MSLVDSPGRYMHVKPVTADVIEARRKMLAYRSTLRDDALSPAQWREWIMGEMDKTMIDGYAGHVPSQSYRSKMIEIMALMVAAVESFDRKEAAKRETPVG